MPATGMADTVHLWQYSFDSNCGAVAAFRGVGPGRARET